jgi:hypothetical protein
MLEERATDAELARGLVVFEESLGDAGPARG